VIQAFERGVEKMGPQVMAKPVRFYQHAAKQGEDSVQKRTPLRMRRSITAGEKPCKRLIVPDALAKTTGNLAGRVTECDPGTAMRTWQRTGLIKIIANGSAARR
jgi:hypothetical protein